MAKQLIFSALVAASTVLGTNQSIASEAVALKKFQSYPPISSSSVGLRLKSIPVPTSEIVTDTSPRRNPSGVGRAAAGPSRAAVTPRAYGTFGIPYTSVRVQDWYPAASATQDNRLSTTFPYSTVGKLDITDFGYCSASLIMRSVIVTAAHCASDFGSGVWFNGWTFRPGHYGAPGARSDQIEPYGAWTIEAGVVSSSWLSGLDTGYLAARNNDVAVFIVSKDDTDTFIGDVVGWMDYGWGNYSFVRSKRTKNLITAATTTLGYPGLLDGGTVMQRADGPTFLVKVKKALQMWQGNNFTTGSSGGPWVVNFGTDAPQFSGGADGGYSSSMNVVVGVTSWGSPDPNVAKDNYSSQFGPNKEFPALDYGGYGGGNIGALLQALCSATAPGSSQTYQQLGYCD